ncbi:type II toxin-antitoxin system VapC family toxin [Geminisphaera colitermitum]|uniref:type II toxin-antitoxin system VapC family toxin n=1 Tax=Geminisphaera colitermitum TaxID=1148786 RepID=UPI000158D49F|nr:type II toxin-antitoxin system VapC family toxin [Geminisphaera colitermitum]
MAFCDTSTLAKYYVPETESGAVRAHLDAQPSVFASELARTELMAVFHRRLREKKWSRDDFQAAVRQFTHDDIGGYWTWFPLDGGIPEQAARTYATLPENVFLRAADCLHLVTALHHGFDEVYSHDAHQIAAASALGLKVIRIE